MPQENIRRNLSPEQLEFYENWCRDCRAHIRRTVRFNLRRDRFYYFHVDTVVTLRTVIEIGKEEYDPIGQTSIRAYLRAIHDNLARLNE